MEIENPTDEITKPGQFWVSNGEYGTQVNYCPKCGAKAPVQVKRKVDP